MRTIAILLLLCHVSFSQDSSAVTTPRALDNEMMLMPTAETFPAGTVYLHSYELFFLNVGVSVTHSTHLSIGSLFPIVKSFTKTFTFGIKQKLFVKDRFTTTATGFYVPESKSYFLGAIQGFRTGNLFVNALVGSLVPNDDDNILVLGIGFINYTSPKRAVITEYFSLREINGGSKDYANIFTFAFRFIGEDVSWEVGAGINIGGDTGGFLPLLKAGFLF